MKKMTLLAFAAGIVATTFGLSACQSDEEASMTQLPVEVVYRERIMLPPTATVTVTLEDVSKMDVAATLIDKQSMNTAAAPPYRLTLSYDANQIDDRMRYALRARIELDGKLLFTNTQSVKAFANKAGEPAQILVQNIASKKQPPLSAKPAQLGNSNWGVNRIGTLSSPLGAQDKEPNLYLQDGKASGFSGCNNFHGSYTLKGKSLKFGPLMSTRRACLEGDAMMTEKLYLEALAAVEGYSLKDGKLKLLSKNLPVVEFTAI